MILAFDCGSTNFKAALFDERLDRLAESAVTVRYLQRDHPCVEFDAEEIWAATTDLVRDVCRAARVETGAIRTVALASQAQTFTALDAAGRPLMPFLSWADTRAAAESEILDKHLGSGFHQHCSFPTPLPQLQLAKLLWVRRHQPDWLPAGARVVSLPGFLALRLAGLNAMDRNLAAMSGLYSLRTGGWWAEALSACGLDAAQLPDLVETGAALTTPAPRTELGLQHPLTLVLAGNDQTANALGNGSEPGALIVTLGTALVVYRPMGRVLGPYSRGGCWGPYPGGGFYELATRDQGCAALDWACRFLLPTGDLNEFLSLANTAPDQPGALLFLPHKMGAAAAWQGTGDLAGKARAVLEGISFSLRQLIEEELQADPRKGLVAVTGGGSASREWRQLLADVLHTPVRHGRGDALLGAARMARPQVPPPAARAGETLAPDPARSALEQQRYQVWRARADPSAR